MFKVPESTPPSTPDTRRSSVNHPSTTPAGPPPTNYTQNSFTPAGLPPTSIFGSSQLDTGNSRIPAPIFGSSNLGNAFPARSSTHTNAFMRANNAPTAKASNLSSFRVPSSSPPARDDEQDGEYEEDTEVEDEDAMEEDDGLRSRGAFSAQSPKRGVSTGAPSSPRSTKRSRYDESMRQTRRSDAAIPIADFGGIAKGIAADLPLPSLDEPGHLIIQTEEIIRNLYEEEINESLPRIADELRALWNTAGVELAPVPRLESPPIGPSEKANPVTKASYIVNLLLQLHYPPASDTRTALVNSRFGRSSIQSPGSRPHVPMPKVLLNWLNKDHDTTAEDLHEILSLENGFSAAEDFWDSVFSCVFRGNFETAIMLLRGANWSVAECATSDGYEEPGYEGRQLQHTEIAVDRAITLLETCPAVTSNDWDIKGNEWALFRHRVRQAITELEAHAEEGKGEELFNLDQSTETARNSYFGISTSSRKATESRLPSFIFESLSDMFNTMLGDPLEVIKTATDWVEAVIGIAVWWDGEEDETTRGGSLAANRRSFQRSQHSRPSDVTPSSAYRDKLKWALNRIWTWADDEQQLQVNTSSSIEVALACVFANDIEGVLALLQKWSMTVAAGTVEVASAGGWLEQSNPRSKDLLQNFDKSDLMVLSFVQEDSDQSQKDRILSKYADLLQYRGALTDEYSSPKVDGWQLAVQVLTRLDDETESRNRISELLDELPLDSDETVDQLITICDQLNLPDHVKGIAERYAENLAATTQSYGSALLYYARAHNTTKMREVLDLLISHCLVTSSAYPAFADLDPSLKSFITSPKQALTRLAREDVEAAELLSTYLSGYATLRRFYDLRDEEVGLKEGQKPKHRPLARKREAAAALIAVIESAEDSIRGGLYDPEVDVVVQVDGLLVLLGEALVFLNQQRHTFSLPQAFAILKAAEDLQTVGSRIFEQCDSVLQAALANYHDGTLPATLSPSKQQPRSLHRSGTSGSGMTGSQFSLLEASTYSSQDFAASPASSGSELLVRARPRTADREKEGGKGWDWRVGFARKTAGKEVLGVLRLAVAKEIADGWMEEEE
ncbi:hypothetical protein NA57DRAFT_74584 [Rhizodiscina lignyota]|uniref:Nuclear pore complex protein Nup85 n=1 Tax=Rhizodiscina lignyota TaxID=1504668 RepID=A0A9P4MCT9_9PEZI|nr:hypothetical protein NA57DRAFT_74584 [Rhizodiscina lignyota]